MTVTTNRWNLSELRQHAPHPLAPHQERAIRPLFEWYENAKSTGRLAGGILALPTGAGKTNTATTFLAEGPLSDGYKVLWLAHTHHLLDQARDAFDRNIGRVRPPREEIHYTVISGTRTHASLRDLSAKHDVVIATLQTIAHGRQEGHASLAAFLDAAGKRLVIVFDEAHHSPAPSYRKLITELQANGAIVLGLTATPTYTDKSKRGWLRTLFPQEILARASVNELVASGVLAKRVDETIDTKVIPEFDDSEFSRWQRSARDLPEDVVDALARNAPRNDLIVDHYVRGKDRYGKTIIFADRWVQCEAIAQGLERRGVRAGSVYSHVEGDIGFDARRTRAKNENEKNIQLFKDGKLDVLLNVRMLTEGSDFPKTQTVFLTRQTTSEILLTQMVGRVLRGPKFGGTEVGYVVSFIDDWRQKIRWAEFDLADGGTSSAAARASERQPLRLVSIELVRRLAQQMAGGTNTFPAPFQTFLPTGWYLAHYDAAEGDDVVAVDRLVLVHDDEEAAFTALIAALRRACPSAFEAPTLDLEAVEPLVETLRQAHFAAAGRAPADIKADILHIARHVGQGEEAPPFFAFNARADHDLDSIAQRFIDNRSGPTEIRETLLTEYARDDRFWRALFPTFSHFRQAKDAAEGRLLDGDAPLPNPTKPLVDTAFVEPDDATKDRVKQRDGHCLCCGTTSRLQVDHIDAAYHGGTADLGNLQTLCGRCNRAKGTQSARFRNTRTGRAAPPRALPDFDAPRERERDGWERYLRAMFNLTYGCGAVQRVQIAARGPSFYNWSVELFDGNDPSWLEPLLADFVARIQRGRDAAGQAPIESLSITAPGYNPVVWG